MQKIVYSSSEIAKLCHYNRETVKRWLENGQLKGYRVGRGHWRVLRHDLFQFLKENAIPVPAEMKAIQTRSGRTDGDGFQGFCWEFFKRSKIRHVIAGKSCRDCLVFRTKAMACYLLHKETGHLKLCCDTDCQNCQYFQMIQGVRKAAKKES